MLSSQLEAQKELPQAYQSFINTNLKFAQERSLETGVPVSVMIAVAISESGCGRSSLAKRSNNIFSIMCSASWQFECEQAKEGLFRKYVNQRESINDFFWLLHDRNFQLRHQSWKMWCSHAAYFGGASREEFWNHIKSIIHLYSLYKLDVYP